MIKLNTINCLQDITLIETLPKGYKLQNSIDIYFSGENNIRLIEDKPKIEITSFDLMKKGGSWLGHVREWIQRKCNNGERVTWGSEDHIQPRSLTVRDMEYLAAQIAANAINEYINKKDIKID